jgi:energy-coupling factor transport system ATP-binding protein
VFRCGYVDSNFSLAKMTAETPSTKTSIEAISGNGDSRLTWVTGNNFSGRSAVLKKACEHFSNQPAAAITIPPEIYLALSALVPTVAEELQLHLGGNSDDAPAFRQLAEKWGLAALAERDPYSLSGGEQSLLIILCKLALTPTLLAIDGALEQLDPSNLNEVLSVITTDGSLPRPPHFLLTHNGTIAQHHGTAIRQVPATIFSDIKRFDKPPPLDVSGFEPPPCQQPAAILLKDVSFHYPRGKTVFSGLNLKLEPGRIYRLAGANGSGKSTLARILTGILPLSDGGIQVNGEQFNSYARPGTLARLHFQSPDSQLFEDTVRAELGSLPSALSKNAARFAGLGGFLDEHPFDLPFVLRKRLALTLILHTTAPWLVFDEPTLGQDEQSRIVLASAFRKLADKGYGIILISHHSDFAVSIADEELDLLRFTDAKNKK